MFFTRFKCLPFFKHLSSLFAYSSRHLVPETYLSHWRTPLTAYQEIPLKSLKLRFMPRCMGKPDPAKGNVKDLSGISNYWKDVRWYGKSQRFLQTINRSKTKRKLCDNGHKISHTWIRKLERDWFEMALHVTREFTTRDHVWSEKVKNDHRS